MLDHYYLNLAFQLAQQNEGNTAPNPSVGAVIVKANRIASWGYHEYAGGPHAEKVALHGAADDAQGATLYCSLEPCAHHGKTPPCVEEIQRYGIQRVVFSAADQNPLVKGKGMEFLQREGIETLQIPLPSIESFYTPFFQTFQTGRAYVIAKAAMTANGIISPADRNSRWITGDTSLKWVHHLRGRCDAILVGADTVLSDRPRLTMRVDGIERRPLRIVLDAKFKLSPHNCSLMEDDVPLLICGLRDASSDREEVWRARDIPTLRFTDVESLLSTLLVEYGVRILLLEGGQRIFTLFHEAECIDEYLLMQAPRFLTGQSALNLLGGQDQALLNSRRYGSDPPLDLDGDVVVRLKKPAHV